MPRWIALVALVPAFALSARAASADPPRLAYRFELVRMPALEVRVHVQVPGSPEGETTLEVDREWGGVRAGGDDIGEVTATDASGNALTLSRPAPNQVVVTHAPGAVLHVTYAFAANDHQSRRDPAESRRPIVNPHLFRTVGHLGLLRPSYIKSDTPCTVRLSWDGFDAAGWRAVSSWGAGTSERTLTASIEDLGEALYLAGDIHLMERDIRGYPLFVTVARAEWRFTPEAFADMCARVVEAERAFFDDFAHEFYWVSLVPTGPLDPQGMSIGGTGLKNCFSLGVSPSTVLTADDGSESEMVRILAHEMFHDWNGITIRREQPEELLYWFSEGFTDFYARRLRYRGGLIGTGQYAASVSQVLERYATSPVRDEPNTRILEDFWNDRDVQKLPYHRGDIVAMILDAAIRKNSGGTQSLDDVMRALLVKGRAGELVTMDKLFATFAQYADAETLARLRDLVENGGMPEIGNPFAPCLAMEPVAVYRFDLGFNLDRSMEAKTVVGLREGSAAMAAGLEEGMTLTRWSVYGGDVSKQAVFRVVVDGAEREVSYYPRGEAVQTFKAVLRGDAQGCEGL